MQAEILNETLRESTLEAAKQHKLSWIKLGQYLYTVYKDKHYRNWGFLNFETYCAKELRIKQTTASKLLKSYYFLEKSKPDLVKADSESSAHKQAPNFESVNMFRLAQNNKKLTSQDVREIEKAVFDQEKEPKEIRAQMKRMLSERDDRNPKEIKQERRNSTIKRLISTLMNAEKELKNGNLLPGYLLDQIGELVVKLEDQLE